MICPHCGKEETKDLQECGWCGKDLQGRFVHVPPEEVKVVVKVIEKAKTAPAPAASKKTVKPSTTPAKKAK